jgi:RNA polymerase sigma-70 factor (sigma-E family)
MSVRADEVVPGRLFQSCDAARTGSRSRVAIVDDVIDSDAIVTHALLPERRGPRHCRPGGRTEPGGPHATRHLPGRPVPAIRRASAPSRGSSRGADAASLSEYVAARRPQLLRRAAQLSVGQLEPEDLLQEALLRLHVAWDRIEDTAAVGGYLRRVMSNHQISQWRRRRVEEVSCAGVPELDSDANADGDLLAVELRDGLRAALATLSERERTVIGLRYFAGSTDMEIAQDLGMSAGTVKSMLWRALRKLRADNGLRDLWGACADREGSADVPLARVA